MTNVSRDIKKSNFTQQTIIPAGSTFDFVYNGTNYKIPVESMITAFGTVGTLSQLGDPTEVPILKQTGSVNEIRNIEAGSGISASISAYNGCKVEHNFTVDETGVSILKDKTAASPTLRSIVAGSGISVAASNGGIQIAVSSTPATSKTVIIDAISDFPTAVVGVITLEADTFYFITNDISTSNRFVLGANTVIGGSDGTLIELEYTGSGNMFTSVDNSNKIRDILLKCSSGTLFDIEGTGAEVFQVLNCRCTCDEIGDIADTYATVFQNVIWAVTTDGLTFTGNNSLVSFFQNIGSISAGTFIDFGTSTFDGFSFANSQGILAAGATFLSGAADSANVNTGGLATVFNTRAQGSGTPLSGITTEDALWEFFSNGGIADSKTTALLTNSGMTLTIAAADTPVKIDSDWTEQIASRFTTTADGIFTYTGAGAYVSFTASVTAEGGGGADDLTFYYYKNGVQITASGVTREFTAGDPGNISMVWSEELETGDYIEIYGENNNDTDDITIVSVQLRFS